jgi:hypothetical protein
LAFLFLALATIFLAIFVVICSPSNAISSAVRRASSGADGAARSYAALGWIGKSANFADLPKRWATPMKFRTVRSDQPN